MQLSALTTSEIRSNVLFGAGNTPYLDGSALEDVPNGLHRIYGIYPVDLLNAIRHDDSKAWDLVLRNAKIRPRC